MSARDGWAAPDTTPPAATPPTTPPATGRPAHEMSTAAGRPLPGLPPVGAFRALDAVDAPPLRHVPLPPPTTVLGVAAGAVGAPAVLCATRYSHVLVTPGDPLFGEEPLWATHYTVLGLERLPAGTTYPQTARRLNTLATRLYNRDVRGDYHVVVDAGAVGHPVVEAIRQSIIPQVGVTGVTITPTATPDECVLWRYAATVGRRYLVSRVQAIVQGARLHVPDEPLGRALLEALRAYPADDAAAERAPHLDLVTALALTTVSDYVPVRYGPRADSLPSPVL